MTQDHFAPKKLLALRKLTRAVADLLREQATGYVAALSPLLRPKLVLGEYADGATRDPVPASEKSLQELQALYAQVAAAAPFNLHKNLKPPLELVGAEVELSPLEYTHVVESGADRKSVKVISPLKWVLSYAGFAPGKLSTVGFPPRRLKEHLTTGSRSTADLQQFVVHYLTMHLAATKGAGVAKVFRDLRFPLQTQRVPDFGQLPVTCVSASISTLRPPDDVLIEHTEIAGTDTFEEVVDVDDIVAMADPMRDKLLEMAKTYGALSSDP